MLTPLSINRVTVGNLTHSLCAFVSTSVRWRYTQCHPHGVVLTMKGIHIREALQAHRRYYRSDFLLFFFIFITIAIITLLFLHRHWNLERLSSLSQGPQCLGTTQWRSELRSFSSTTPLQPGLSASRAWRPHGPSRRLTAPTFFFAV